MEELIEQLVTKVGLDKATAEKVANFIAEHVDDIPGWLAQTGLKNKLPGGLGGLF